MSKSAQGISEHTLNWIKSFVIDFNICPFAKRVVEQGTLTISVTNTNKTEEALEALMDAVYLLDNNLGTETVLLVFSNFLTDFYDYLDLVDLAEALLSEQQYDGVYQLATFHPEYCFAGVSPQEPSNYTNRSPYPMLHLLRETSVDAAISYYGDTEQIPEHNIALLQQLGLEKIKKLLNSIG